MTPSEAQKMREFVVHILDLHQRQLNPIICLGDMAKWIDENEKKSHRIVAIGYLGGMVCYLDMTKEEAIERYKKDNEYMAEKCETSISITEFEFTDHFGAVEYLTKLRINTLPDDVG